MVVLSETQLVVPMVVWMVGIEVALLVDWKDDVMVVKWDKK